MKFMDEYGQSWEVTIDEETIYAMRLIGGKQSFTGPTDLPQDFGDIVKCIAVACSEDCERRGMLAKDLIPLLTGKTLNVALDAFVRAYLDFWEPLFPLASGRLLKEWNKIKKKLAAKRQARREQLATV